MRLSGKRALVTGASSGIGADLARQLAALGASLVVTARRRERLTALAEEISARHGTAVQVEDLDLSQPGAAAELFARTEGQGKPIDLLISNAGFGLYEDFVRAPWERYAEMLQVNVVALTHLAHLFVPAMIARRRGWVMNVSSIGAYTPTPSFAVYGASKTYVRNFSEVLDHELRGNGVRAISICPGATRTEFMATAKQRITRTGELVIMSSERCARIAIAKMLAGRRNVVTGVLNAIGMWLLRFVPRALMPWVAKRFMSAGVEKAT